MVILLLFGGFTARGIHEYHLPKPATNGPRSDGKRSLIELRQLILNSCGFLLMTSRLMDSRKFFGERSVGPFTPTHVRTSHTYYKAHNTLNVVVIELVDSLICYENMKQVSGLQHLRELKFPILLFDIFEIFPGKWCV